MRGRRSNKSFAIGGVGTGFGDVTANDLDFLDQALASQQRQLSLQNSQIQFASNMLSLTERSYNVQRKLKFDKEVEVGRSEATKFVTDLMSRGDHDALAQLQEYQLGLPAEIASDPAVRNSFTTAISIANREQSERHRVESNQEDSAMDALNMLGASSANHAPFIAQAKRLLREREGNSHEVMEQAYDKLSDVSINNISFAASEFTLADGRIDKDFASKFGIDSSSDSLDSKQVHELIVESVFKQAGTSKQEYEKMETSEKIAFLPKINSFANSMLSFHKEINTKKKTELVNHNKLESLKLKDKVKDKEDLVKDTRALLLAAKKSLAGNPKDTVKQGVVEKFEDELETLQTGKGDSLESLRKKLHQAEMGLLTLPVKRDDDDKRKGGDSFTHIGGVNPLVV